MSATSAPFGLRPAYHPSGIIRPTALSIASGYGSNIYQFQPVLITTDGVVEGAGDSDPIVGTFMGVEFTDTDGRRRVSNKWTASTSATDIVAYVTLDPAIVYEIQANGSVSVTNIGNQADFANAASGNVTTGLSLAQLDRSGFVTSGNKVMRVMAIAPEVGNAAGDSFTIVQVQISEHQYVANKAAF